MCVGELIRVKPRKNPSSSNFVVCEIKKILGISVDVVDARPQ